MELYAGMDLHSRNTYIGIMDKSFNRIFKKRVPNDLDQILQTLSPYQDKIKGFVVESTYNWYWLIDGLMDSGYSGAHLANPSAIKQYEGLKHIDDQHDAFFLAQLLILGILPEGYIYPKKVKLNKGFRQLLTIPGIGNILAMTIMLEVGDISRFPKVGNFASYCRCVSSQRLSDGKSKGHGNRKNGNRYLSWALTEAAHLSRRHNERFRRYYNRKVAQANTSLATKALSNKLARICYYIMRDQVAFREELISH